MEKLIWKLVWSQGISKGFPFTLTVFSWCCKGTVFSHSLSLSCWSPFLFLVRWFLGDCCSFIGWVSEYQIYSKYIISWFFNSSIWKLLFFKVLQGFFSNGYEPNLIVENYWDIWKGRNAMRSFIGNTCHDWHMFEKVFG